VAGWSSGDMGSPEGRLLATDRGVHRAGCHLPGGRRSARTSQPAPTRCPRDDRRRDAGMMTRPDGGAVVPAPPPTSRHTATAGYHPSGVLGARSIL
jgi:hypothetical protein